MQHRKLLTLWVLSMVGKCKDLTAMVIDECLEPRYQGVDVYCCFQYRDTSSPEMGNIMWRCLKPIVYCCMNVYKVNMIL